jgi:hypothetical protein
MLESLKSADRGRSLTEKCGYLPVWQMCPGGIALSYFISSDTPTADKLCGQYSSYGEARCQACHMLM